MKPVLILSCLLIVSTVAQQTPTPAEREARWRQDFQALAAGLKAPGIKIAGGIATRAGKISPCIRISTPTAPQ